MSDLRFHVLTSVLGQEPARAGLTHCTHYSGEPAFGRRPRPYPESQI